MNVGCRYSGVSGKPVSRDQPPQFCSVGGSWHALCLSLIAFRCRDAMGAGSSTASVKPSPHPRRPHAAPSSQPRTNESRSSSVSPDSSIVSTGAKGTQGELDDLLEQNR